MGLRAAFFTCSALFLAFAAQVALADTRVLTESNFDRETKDGDAGVHVGKVDCTTERSICERFSVQSYPTLKVVTGGRSFDYAGSREQAALAEFALSGHKTSFSEKVLSYPEFATQREIAQREQLEAERSSQVVTLTSANFDEVAPLWHRLSKSLLDSGSSTKVAKVDCTVHRRVCSRFGVAGYPTLFFVKDGQVYKYQQSRSLNAFLDFVNGGYEKETAVGPIADETLLSSIVDTTVEWASENTVMAVMGVIALIALVVAVLVALLDRCLGENDIDAPLQAAKNSPAGVAAAAATAATTTKSKDD
ncbi:hypothetical protein PybrP1_010949 [[Pythium] brassicae (nom. inval.)]|nr:hypothetical protein PybrP1_010949 [[Pythium] brassicae (nom. inval.)]